jgi:hypothetical protein
VECAWCPGRYAARVGVETTKSPCRRRHVAPGQAVRKVLQSRVTPQFLLVVPRGGLNLTLQNCQTPPACSIWCNLHPGNAVFTRSNVTFARVNRAVACANAEFARPERLNHRRKRSLRTRKWRRRTRKCHVRTGKRGIRTRKFGLHTSGWGIFTSFAGRWSRRPKRSMERTRGTHWSGIAGPRCWGGPVWIVAGRGGGARGVASCGRYQTAVGEDHVLRHAAGGVAGEGGGDRVGRGGSDATGGGRWRRRGRRSLRQGGRGMRRGRRRRR